MEAEIDPMFDTWQDMLIGMRNTAVEARAARLEWFEATHARKEKTVRGLHRCAYLNGAVFGFAAVLLAIEEGDSLVLWLCVLASLSGVVFALRAAHEYVMRMAVTMGHAAALIALHAKTIDRIEGALRVLRAEGQEAVRLDEHERLTANVWQAIAAIGEHTGRTSDAAHGARIDGLKPSDDLSTDGSR